MFFPMQSLLEFQFICMKQTIFEVTPLRQQKPCCFLSEIKTVKLHIYLWGGGKGLVGFYTQSLFYISCRRADGACFSLTVGLSTKVAQISFQKFSSNLLNIIKKNKSFKLFLQQWELRKKIDRCFGVTSILHFRKFILQCF